MVGFDARRIVMILAVFAFVVGTLLDIGAADHGPLDAAMESAQAHAAPLDVILDGVLKSHCQQNAGCHVAILPDLESVIQIGAAGTISATWREMAESEHLNDLFRPPLHV
ncbi:hypothetical protein P1J78_21845 [Psychromarinibacter sp. C21-152]|uniref:Uncharacterized protein n=1 Tax=Psychromarinibacter sediminicola TaxID=3033385 RepID=A0AAE3NSB5_9RHOB|nr:hypothetical protein [Psychromarinibacter sediminicola]MDF0603378.1 hypothetical protein [Psychromarinibacter sediminicola]